MKRPATSGAPLVEQSGIDARISLVRRQWRSFSACMRRTARVKPTLTLALSLAGCATGTGCATGAGAGAGAQPPGAAAILQTAQRAASASADPVAVKLALWLRAQMPDAASASEIDAFLRANPDWPGRSLLDQRLQQALAVEPDDAVARALCASHRPDTTLSLLRCATALSAPGVLLPPGAVATPALPLSPGTLPAAVATAASAAWVGGIDDAPHEAEFLRVFGPLPTVADQWRRFDRQEWSGAAAAAARQVARLAPAMMPLASTRLALRRGDTGADGLAAALRGEAAANPEMLLDLARWLRRHDRDDEALALWHDRALAAERAAGGARMPAFWREREALARELLSRQRDADALFLAHDEVQTDQAVRLDIDFLTGWIELRRLHAAPDAAQRFAELTRASRSVITTSRGFYWLGRALDEQGRAAEARDAYARAAARPTSFYGQAAVRLLSPDDDVALAAAIARLRDPAWTPGEAIRFAGLELARAATLLVAWNDPHQARAFLLRLDERADDDRDHGLGASFADRLGLPDVAVAIARGAGRHGLVLAGSGWPAPYIPASEPSLPAGLALAIMRQESSFDATVVSPAGARGLMQLMPATARTVAAMRIDAGTLADPTINMAIGTTYLDGLLRRFGGTIPYAVAAYNAGPNRVRQWLQQNGDPAAAQPGIAVLANAAPNAAMIDWIEMIPFTETRNYVQRVMENQVVYRARIASAPPGRITWTVTRR